MSNSPNIAKISAKHLAGGRPIPQGNVVQGSGGAVQWGVLRLSNLICLLPSHPTEANVHLHHKSSQTSLQTCKILSVVTGNLSPGSHPQPLRSQITCPFASALLGPPHSSPCPGLLPWCLLQPDPSRLSPVPLCHGKLTLPALGLLWLMSATADGCCHQQRQPLWKKEHEHNPLWLFPSYQC